jgi:hypothetical protein
MRGWVCRLRLLLALASKVILWSEFRGTHNHILLSWVRDSPNLEGQVPVCISPRKRGICYTPRLWVPFSSPPTIRRSTVEVFDPAATQGVHILPGTVRSSSRYTASGRTPQKTLVAYCCMHYLATGCLPIICLRGKIFNEPLPSNKSIGHNINEC